MNDAQRNNKAELEFILSGWLLAKESTFAEVVISEDGEFANVISHEHPSKNKRLKLSKYGKEYIFGDNTEMFLVKGESFVEPEEE